MRFEFTAEEEAFRADLCVFLQRELTPEVWREHRDANEQGFWTPDFIKAFRRKLGAAGYIGMGWPAEYGGGGAAEFIRPSLPRKWNTIVPLAWTARLPMCPTPSWPLAPRRKRRHFYLV